MTMRERLRSIPDLMLAQRLGLMSNSQMDDYGKLLSSFVEQYPSQESAIKTALEGRDLKALTRLLSALRETLIEIHADDLAEECWRRLNSFDEDRPDKIEAYVSFLLSTLTALSIDIQVAFYKEDDEEYVGLGPGDQKKEGEDLKSILAVDDDPYSLDTFKAALKDLKCKIIGATSGLSALGVLNTLKPDLFVLDIEMPGMDGLELAGEIRKRGHGGPIIFITGKSTRDYVQKCMEAGASDFIVKPINPSHALGRIQKFL
ncbi:MAG: response regulator [Treponema sp.]|nr:response regulator [Treponema sp.]